MVLKIINVVATKEVNSHFLSKYLNDLFIVSSQIAFIPVMMTILKFESNSLNYSFRVRNDHRLIREPLHLLQYHLQNELSNWNLHQSSFECVIKIGGSLKMAGFQHTSYCQNRSFYPQPYIFAVKITWNYLDSIEQRPTGLNVLFKWWKLLDVSVIHSWKWNQLDNGQIDLNAFSLLFLNNNY